MARIAIEFVDGWLRLAGSRFVGPGEYRGQLSDDAARALGLSTTVDRTLIQALARAADDAGLLVDFKPEQFYCRSIGDLLRDDNDRPDWGVVYDRFVELVIAEMRLCYLERGLLAQRGTGVEADCRLTLPAVVPAPRAGG